MKKINILLLFLFTGMMMLDATVISWDGEAGDDLWSSATNWSTDAVPAPADSVLVGGSVTVKSASNQFAHLEIAAGATVLFQHQPNNNKLTVAGTVGAASGAFRVQSGSVVNLTGAIAGGGSWLDFNASTINFADGSSIDGYGNFEMKGASQTLGFTLTENGFTTIETGNLVISGTQSWSKVTLNVDMSAYTGTAVEIELMKFNSHNAVYNGDFDATVNLNDGGRDLGYEVTFVKATSTISLIKTGEWIDPSIGQWTGNAGDNQWATAGNWSNNTVPGGGSDLIVGNNAQVEGGTKTFGSLVIQEGAKVTFDQNFQGNVVSVAGTMDRSGGAFRIQNNSIVDLTGTLGGSFGWLDFNASTINFVDGAMIDPSVNDFEMKGNTQTLGFKLSEMGFLPIGGASPTFRLQRSGDITWANVIFNVDISDYNLVDSIRGDEIILMDFTGHNDAYSEGFELASLNLEKGGQDLKVLFSFKTDVSQIALLILPNKNIAPIVDAQYVSTFVDTAVNVELSALDLEDDSVMYTMIGAVNGSVDGTVPNYTYTPSAGFMGIDTISFVASDGNSNAEGKIIINVAPYDAKALWSSLQDKIENDPLNAEVLSSWTSGDVTISQIRYELGELKGTQVLSATPKIAAYYAYPTSGTNLPAIVQIHGGGQRASKDLAEYYAKQGYACISINWGGLELESGLANTDWDGIAAGFEREGVVAAIHHERIDGDAYVDGATLFKGLHPLNNSFLLNAYCARRAITFLQAQSNIDADKIGVEGHSMGGRTTTLAATDPRIKCIAPSVGGSGYLYEDMWGLPGTARTMQTEGMEWYNRTVGCENYWSMITCPTLYLEATNDFNAPFDFVVKALGTQPTDVAQRMAMAPHFNHRFDANAYASRVLWHKQYLKGDFTMPATAEATLDLETSDSIPMFTVTPDATSTLPIQKVNVYYGYGRDSRTRFWRSAEVVDMGDGTWKAQCTVYDTDEPLFVFANVIYGLDFDLPLPAGYSETTRQFSIASEVKSIYPETLQAAVVKQDSVQVRTIDDFSLGMQDWYVISGDNNVHWQYYTRKLLDPKWTGKADAKLTFSVTTTAHMNTMAVQIVTNEWNPQDANTYTKYVSIGNAGTKEVTLYLSDFKNAAGDALENWENITILGFMGAAKVRPSYSDWYGEKAVIGNLKWIGDDYIEDHQTSFLPQNRENVANVAILASQNTVSIKGCIQAYTLYDLNGRKLKTSLSTTNYTEFSIDKGGIYIVEVCLPDASMYRQKIAIK